MNKQTGHAGQSATHGHTGTPDVSVVMPAFNAQKDILESVGSVLAQTHESIELVVVDDASVDRTADLVQGIARNDPRVRLFCNETNQGVSFSRNRGMKHARGRFLMFLDSDDAWDETKVETQLAFMRASQCAISYMDYSRFNDAATGTQWRVTAPARIAYEDLLASNEIGMLTAAIDRRRIPDLPAFVEHGHEDYVFWLELLRTLPQPALKVPSSKPLARYRQRADSISSDRLRSVLWHWQVLARQKQSFPARVVFMVRYFQSALKKRNALRQYLSHSAK